VMDESWIYLVGATQEYDGIKSAWMGSVSPEGLKAAMGKPYVSLHPARASKYLYKKGEPVFLLIPPNSKGVWVMQSWTNHVQKSLTYDALSQLRSMLTLPAGWRFETKVLDRDLTITPLPPAYKAYTTADNFLNIYAGCGFDNACNYVP
jgi:hypothetical protein